MNFLNKRYPLMNVMDPGTGGGGNPTPNPAPAPNPNPTPTPAPTNDWTTGLSDEYKGFVQTKGFKDPSSVIESYRNLEKHLGIPKERLLTLPENMEDANSLNAIFDKLGRPSKSDEYSFQVAEEAGGEEFGKFLKGLFHESGLTKKQAETIMTKYGEYFTGEVTKTQTQMQAEFDRQTQALKTEWGAAHDQNINVAKKAAVAFKLDAGTIDKLEAALGYDGVMKFLHNVGSKIGEDSFVGGNPGQGGGNIHTPEAAKYKISELTKDPAFGKRLLDGDVAAKTEWEALHKQAYPEQKSYAGY